MSSVLSGLSVAKRKAGFQTPPIPDTLYTRTAMTFSCPGWIHFVASKENGTRQTFHASDALSALWVKALLPLTYTSANASTAQKSSSKRLRSAKWPGTETVWRYQEYPLKSANPWVS